MGRQDGRPVAIALRNVSVAPMFTVILQCGFTIRWAEPGIAAFVGKW